MINQAVILTARLASPEDVKVAKLLRFFSVQWQALTIAEFFAQNAAGNESSSKSRLICSSEVFLKLTEELKRNPDCMPHWEERIHSAFVYAGDDSESLQILVRSLIGDNGATIHETNSGAGDLAVSNELKDFCGVMAGVRVTASRTNENANRALSFSKGIGINIISAVSGASFLKVDYQHVPVFLLTSQEVIDVEADLASRIFDVRDHFLSAVPIVLYIKWAFPEICWNAPEANACLVIDDPLLKPSYGCVDFEELLALMESHRFSTNVAFIPWNWRRSNPKVVRLFNQKPQYYSLSIHGCDHTAAEFGSHDRERLHSKVKKAIDRMSGHQTQTGIHHDKIMVFPQGVFSETAMDVLKHSNFTAAVNSDVISTDLQPKAITISDYWGVAVMRYGTFPMFTRRDPSEGIENFAFDILLGKPCIIVIHHDFCRDRYKHLLDFINGLNALNCSLSWRSLGDVVRRSCRRRPLASGEVEIEMYGAELRLENRSAQEERYLIRRRECEPSTIKEIHDETGPIAWKFANGHIDFETNLASGQTKTIGITFHEVRGAGHNGENVSYRFRTMLRRYLSEVRDNYIVKNNLRLLLG